MLRDQNRIPVGHLWIKTDSNGNEYLAGVISFGIRGEVPIVVFREQNKRDDKAPDYVIRNATSERKED